jgi:GNAT superfamily N-acetyltransferase
MGRCNETMPTIVPVSSAVHRESARMLISEYLHWIGESAQREYKLSFDVDAMVESDMSDPEKFHPPYGRFYVVRENDAFVAVGCLKRLDELVGEVQRMYVRASARGKGIGHLIVDRLIVDARQIGYRKLRLESLKFLAAAHALYKSVGFVEIDPYGGNSMREYQASGSITTYQSSVVFMEMTL